jgi:hypothetical protein
MIAEYRMEETKIIKIALENIRNAKHKIHNGASKKWLKFIIISSFVG